MCGFDITLLATDFSGFQLKFTKSRDGVSFQLRSTTPGTSAFGSGVVGHSVKGKGAFGPN